MIANIGVFLAFGSIAVTAVAADGRMPPPAEPAVRQLQEAEIPEEPRLGDVMREIAYRVSNAYWAAHGGNWGLAQYQIALLHDAFERVVKHSPKKRAMLRDFEASYSLPLLVAIERKNLSQFNQRFKVMIDGCNLCHVKHNRGFLKYRIPEAGETGTFLDFSTRTEPSLPGAR